MHDRNDEKWNGRQSMPIESILPEPTLGSFVRAWFPIIESSFQILFPQSHVSLKSLSSNTTRNSQLMQDNSESTEKLFIRAPITKPVTWTEIQDILEKNEVHRLSRTPQVLDKYLERISLIKSNFDSIEDFIFHRFWKVDVEINPKTGKNRMKEGTQIENLQPTILFMENEFPYCVEDGVDHYIVWHLQPMNTLDLYTVLEKNLPGHQYLPYKNPMDIRSVKKIDHWQVFAKKA